MISIRKRRFACVQVFVCKPALAAALSGSTLEPPEPFTPLANTLRADQPVTALKTNIPAAAQLLSSLSMLLFLAYWARHRWAILD
jgi:hypothetical protein